MSNRIEPTVQQGRPDHRTANNVGDGESQTDILLARTGELPGSAPEIDTHSVEKQYWAMLAALVECKRDQASRIEDKLENLIEQQSSRLQQTIAQQPGLIALPGSRARWQQQVQQHQSNLHRLHGRLELVREIRDGMGVHGNNIEALAARKLCSMDPALALGWDEQQAALRHRLAVQRKKPHSQLQAQGTSDGRGWSLSNTIRIDHPN